MEKLQIFIDDREKGPQMVAALREFPDAIVKRLDVGDYVIGPLAIEFKSLADFSQDSGNDLWTKLFALEPYPHRMLVLMGTLDEWRDSDPRYKYHRDVWEATKARFEGTLAAIYFNRAVSVVWVSDEREWIHWLKVFIKRLEREPREFQRPVETRKPAGRTTREVQEDLLCAMDGVGRKAASKLMERYMTPRALAEATADDIAEIPGVGPKRAEHIRRVFNEKADDA